MLIAHLPSGYLLGRATDARGPVMAAALLGAVAPDLDMLWFHFVASSTHHHRFWPHIPAVWIIIAAITLPLCARFRHDWLRPACVFFAAIALHLLLDSLAGDIMWLWPLNDQFYALTTVPATQPHWMLSFVLHWAFLMEIAICLWAVFLLLKRPRKMTAQH